MLSLYAIATRGQDKNANKKYIKTSLYSFMQFLVHTIINYIMNMDAQKRIQKYHIKLHFNCIKRVHTKQKVYSHMIKQQCKDDLNDGRWA